jgi:glutamine amidotransferase
VVIFIFDLGIGNLSSVQFGFERCGESSVLIASGADWSEQLAVRGLPQAVILPGVGAFGDAMFQLKARGLLVPLRKAARLGVPLLGICLGMQLLFATSEESTGSVGLHLLDGDIRRLPSGFKVPHMGWNSLERMRPHPLVEGVDEGEYVYFVHSFYAEVPNPKAVVSVTPYAGVEVPAIVADGNLCGTQFHPEKSGPVGHQILQNFVHWSRGIRERMREEGTDVLQL